MINDKIDALISFLNPKNIEEFKGLKLPIELNNNQKENFLEKEFRFFIGDIEGFSKSLDWMNDNDIFPEKIILLEEGFNPKNHIKKETIIIRKISDLESILFWEKVLNSSNDVEKENYSFGINNIFEIGGVVDDINLFFQDKDIKLLDIHNSIFKLSQFLSSLYYNHSIEEPSYFNLKTFENREGVDLELRIVDHNLDPNFLLLYLYPQSRNYSNRLLFSSFETSIFSEVIFNKNILVVRLRFQRSFALGAVLFRVDKIIEPLEKLIDPDGLSAEKTGLFLGLKEKISNPVHPGIEHSPILNKNRRKNVEELIVRVLGSKENFNDSFDLEKIKSIINEDPKLKSVDYSNEELQRVCDISNDVESTVILARAKEDVFNQVVNENTLEEEIINSINSITKEDLPFLVSGKGEINLENNGTVTVREPDSVIVDEKFVILGEDKHEKEDLVTKINSLTQKIKEEIITVKGNLKDKKDVDEFIIKVTEKEAPELKKYGHQISRNIMSGFVSKRVNEVVNSSKHWEKMNEMITSFKKKLEQRDKQITSLSSTIETLKFKNSEMHPVFKEIVEATEVKEDNIDKKYERIIHRKDQYIKKLESKLLDKQFGEVKKIKSDMEGVVKSDVVFKNKDEEKVLFKEDAEEITEKASLLNDDSTDDVKKSSELMKEVEKFKSIGKSMAIKLSDLNNILKDYKLRNTDLLVERNKLHKEKQIISLNERKSQLIIADLELKLSKAREELGHSKKSSKKEIASKEALIEQNFTRKIIKLESMNEKLSEGTKSLAKKLTELQNEHNKMKTDKRILENRLRFNEIELEKHREAIKNQTNKKVKAA